MINFEEIKPVLRIGARQNFWLFCCYYDYKFFAIKRRFAKEVALLFQEVIDEYKKGNSMTVSVSMPPRSLKSYITSLFSAFWLTQFPDSSVMRNSCTTTLYQKFSYDTRNIIKSTKFKEVFPEIELQPDRQNIDGWNLTTAKQVSYFGSGVGGTIIGFGAAIAISDDLYKSMQDALSASTDNAVKMWKQSAHDSRMEKNCPEIFIGTRWAKNDIIGEAIESGRITKSIIVPALVEGQSFCEDVKSTDEYLAIKDRIGDSIWEAEYMQNPLSKKGTLLPLSELKFTTFNIDEALYRFAVGDPADKGGDKFSIPFCEVYQVNDDMIFFVRDVIFSTDGVDATVNRTAPRLELNRSEHIYYEANGLGLAAVLLQQKNKPKGCTIVPFNSSEQKDVRILSYYEFVQKHFIFNEKYKDNKEYVSFINDLTSYSRDSDNKHKKDAIDSICLAAKIVKLKYKL